MSSPRKKVGGPAVASRTATTTPIVNSKYTAEDGYVAPDAADRFEDWILAEAERLGYRLSVACVDCGHPLVTKSSIAAHRGPTCRRRAGVGK